ncbi:hypothetical protein [Chitinophaga caseinilytica]|uniref:hypothetical protein n=1 Tax=Chitinophaga caseinilytica TaxID=2267521 RepID=UPI003C2AFC7D
MSGKYAHYTPYQFAGNKVIESIDLDGQEDFHYTRKKDDKGKSALELIGQKDIVDNVIVGYRNGHSLFNDALVPVYAQRVNERKEFVVHHTYVKPVDVNGGMNADQPQEWRAFDVRWTHKSLEDALSGRNGVESLLDRYKYHPIFSCGES